MIDHVTIAASDPAATERFYAAVLPAIGRSTAGDAGVVVAAAAGRAVTTGLHIGLVAAGEAEVRAFWQAGVDAGYRSDGEPGPRAEYGPDYFGGFLLDPDGNSVEAMLHENLRDDGCIDHLWVRVADLAASRRFYAELGERAGFREVAGHDERTRYSPGPHRGSFTVVDGDAATTPFGLTLLGGSTHEPVRDPDGHLVDVVPGR